MAKGVEYFIASRTSQLERGGGGSIMMRVATIAVSLAIAVMVVTLAVITGFRLEIEAKFTSLSGQLLITSVGGAGSLSPRPIVRDQALEELIFRAAERSTEGGTERGTEGGTEGNKSSGERIERILPFVTRGVILRTAEGVEGVALKGLGAEADFGLFERGLIEGEVPRFGTAESGRNALISKVLADEMKIELGDKLELLTTTENDSNRAIRRDLYRVGGIYTLNLGESEKRLILTDIRNVRRLNNFAQNEISGYDIWYSSTERAPELAERVNEMVLMAEGDVGNGVAAYSAQSLYPTIFDWLAAHNINAAVVIIIMMVVAIFNIITAMLIMVLERTRLIGLLKVLGMQSKAIHRIFIYRALSVTMWGMLWGNGVAILLCLLQRHFGLIELDEGGYLLSTVPISLGWWWLLLLNVGVVAVVAVVVVVPTSIVSRIEPSEAIKFD
ncbi:MAG: FtsX-like permease family protein [Rikenellaceae bacterium]